MLIPHAVAAIATTVPITRNGERAPGGTVRVSPNRNSATANTVMTVT